MAGILAASLIVILSMSKHFRPWKIDQVQLFPPSVEEFVPDNHLSRFIVALVRESLDLKEIAASYASNLGQPPFDPWMMTSLLLHAYASGLYSSRRIAKACIERADFLMIVALDAPDFRTISEFRKRHLQALASLFLQVLKLAEAAGLVKLGHVALDGTKIKANASKHKAMSYERMKKREAELQAEVDRWLAAAEAADAEEEKAFGKDRRGDEMPAWIVDKEKRLAKIREAKAALEAEAQAAAEAEAKARQEAEAKTEGRKKGGKKPEPPSGEPEAKTQRNFTDPDSRILLTKATMHRPPWMEQPKSLSPMSYAKHERSGTADAACRWRRTQPWPQAQGGLSRCRLLQRGQSSSFGRSRRQRLHRHRPCQAPRWRTARDRRPAYPGDEAKTQARRIPQPVSLEEANR